MPETPQDVTESDVKSRIIAVATSLFATRGYGSTSVREVVEAAGVTKPTLYYWFENKAALYREVVEFHLDQLERFIAEVIQSEGTVRERLHRLTDTYVRGALERKDVVRLLATAHRPMERDQPEVDLMSVHLRRMALLTDLFREGIDTGELREDLDLLQAVLAYTGIINLHAMACVEGMPLQADFADTTMDLFFRGVAA